MFPGRDGWFMNRVNKVAELLEMLQRTCDTGFVLALHVRFTRPLVLYRTYPQSWCDHYDLNGLVMLDPAVRWSFCNTGVIQWDDPSLDDPGGVVEAARAHGVPMVSPSLSDRRPRAVWAGFRARPAALMRPIWTGCRISSRPCIWCSTVSPRTSRGPNCVRCVRCRRRCCNRNRRPRAVCPGGRHGFVISAGYAAGAKGFGARYAAGAKA
ncbi:hypothetical protein CCR90_10985 [Rhodovulum sulfidophilum]|nr:hypothetical protein [Rhodovulum sulfidophilum]